MPTPGTDEDFRVFNPAKASSSSKSNRSSKSKRLGQLGEACAKATLLQSGAYKFLAQNWRFSRHGELDLVMLNTSHALEDFVLVAIEVKTRSGDLWTGIDSITPSKQQRLLTGLSAFYDQWDDPRKASIQNFRLDLMLLRPNSHPTEEGRESPFSVTHIQGLS